MEVTKKEKKPCVLVMASTFPRWVNDSQPRFVLDLSKRLGSEFRIVVLAPHCEGARRHEVLEGLEVVRFRYAPIKWQTLTYNGGMLSQLKLNPLRIAWLPVFFLSMILSGMVLIRKNRCVAVHAHWVLPQGLAAVCAIILSYPRRIGLIVTCHGIDIHSLGGSGWLILKRWVLRRSRLITVVSTALRTSVVNLEPGVNDKVYVAPMGTDLKNLFYPIPGLSKSDHPSLLFVGRLVKKKGVFFLLEAMLEVVKRFPDAKLKIIGDGPLRNSLEKYCLHNGLREVVTFTGAIPHDELPGYYREAHVAVFPFVEEGLGLVVVEAQGCGCPVIGSHIPALNDTVFGKQRWLLCEPENATLLAKKIKEVLSLDAKEIRLEEEYIEKLHSFDWEEVAKKYQDIYSRVVRDVQ